MATVTVRYFALLRELAGKDQETVVLEAGDTGRALYYRLAETYKFTLQPDHLRLAINQEFVAFDEHLRQGDEVVFIPPVAGG